MKIQDARRYHLCGTRGRTGMSLFAPNGDFQAIGDTEAGLTQRAVKGAERPATHSRCEGGPLVSILIPAYNAQEWIADSIRSAVAQTWERKEIIVVDDGSRDRTPKIVQEFQGAGVRLIIQPNQGAAAARNTALAASRGDYIQWLDADDLLSPDKIERQLAALPDTPQNKRILLSCPFGQFIYRYYRTKFIPTPLWADLSPCEWLFRKMDGNAYMQTATWLVSRELTEAAGPWDSRLLGDDDGEYFCRVLLASDGVHFVPEPRVYYRTPFPQSLSRLGRSDRKVRAHWLSMQMQIGYLLGLENSEQTRAACVNFLRVNLISFYPEWSDIVKEVEAKTRELGGEFAPPQLPWKYSGVRDLMGWRPAKLLSWAAPRLRWAAQRRWDKLLFSLHSRFLGVSPPVASSAPALSPEQYDTSVER